MKTIIKCLLFLTVIFGVSGCGTSTKDFEGTSYSCKWKDDTYSDHKNHIFKHTFQFYEGGSAQGTIKCTQDNETIANGPLTWKIDGKYIKIQDGEVSLKIESDGTLVSTSDGRIYTKDN